MSKKKKRKGPTWSDRQRDALKTATPLAARWADVAASVTAVGHGPKTENACRCEARQILKIELGSALPDADRRAKYARGRAADDVATPPGVSREPIGPDRAVPPGKAPKERLELDQDRETQRTSIDSVSYDVNTPEDAMARAQLDPDEWEIKRVRTNSWEVAAKVGARGSERFVARKLWQIRLDLEPRVKPESETIREAVADLMEEFSGYEIPNPLTPSVPDEGYMYEIFPTDLHAGARAWSGETGEDYDTAIAIRRYENAVKDLVDVASPFPISKIVFGIGSDMLHADGMSNSTTKGTPVDVDGRIRYVLQRVVRATIRSIDRCLRIAPVHAVLARGNHDGLLGSIAADFLAIRYEGNPAVTLDIDDRKRKYVRHGDGMLILAHGDKAPPERQIAAMRAERPVDFAEAEHVEVHTGHLHTRKKLIFDAEDERAGIVWRVLPALCGTDLYHSDSAFVGNKRAAQGFLWRKRGGVAAAFTAQARDD